MNAGLGPVERHLEVLADGRRRRPTVDPLTPGLRRRAQRFRPSRRMVHASTDSTTRWEPAHGSRPNTVRTSSSDGTSTTRTTRRSSARGPPSTTTPASTRPSMNAACSIHPDCPSIGFEGSQSGPRRRSTTKNVVMRSFYSVRARSDATHAQPRRPNTARRRWRAQPVGSSASGRPAASRPSINATVAPLSGRSRGGGSGIGSARAVGICSTSRRATASDAGSPVR